MSLAPFGMKLLCRCCSLSDRVDRDIFSVFFFLSYKIVICWGGLPPLSEASSNADKNPDSHAYHSQRFVFFLFFLVFDGCMCA